MPSLPLPAAPCPPLCPFPPAAAPGAALIPLEPPVAPWPPGLPGIPPSGASSAATATSLDAATWLNLAASFPAVDLRESHGVMPDVGWGGAILTDVDRLSVAYPTERVDARWILEMRVEFFPNTGYAQVCRLRFQPFKLRGIGATLDLLQFSPVTRKTITRIADVNHYSACGGRKSYHAHSVYSRPASRCRCDDVQESMPRAQKKLVTIT